MKNGEFGKKRKEKVIQKQKKQLLNLLKNSIINYIEFIRGHEGGNTFARNKDERRGICSQNHCSWRWRCR